jgi:hypothetical protein
MMPPLCCFPSLTPHHPTAALASSAVYGSAPQGVIVIWDLSRRQLLPEVLAFVHNLCVYPACRIASSTHCLRVDNGVIADDVPLSLTLANDCCRGVLGVCVCLWCVCVCVAGAYIRSPVSGGRPVQSGITALCWDMEALELFSGDEHGCVVRAYAPQFRQHRRLTHVASSVSLDCLSFPCLSSRCSSSHAPRRFLTTLCVFAQTLATRAA